MSEFLATMTSAPTVVFTTLLGVVGVYWALVLLGALDLDLDMDGDVDTGIDAFGFGGVPVTVGFSLIILVGWGASMLLDGPLKTALATSAPDWAVSTGIGAVAFALAVPVARLTSRPLRGLFRIDAAPTRPEFVGRSCTIATQRVDADFGQAEIDDGQVGLLVPVRCHEANTLKKGDVAVVFDYDATSEIYLVAPWEGEEAGS